MSAAPDSEAIHLGVREVVARSLAAPVERVAIDARLREDLGVDSIDLLDLLFGLEKRFSVSLQGEELRALADVDPGPERLTPDGHLREEDVGRLLPWLPALAASEERHRLAPRRVAAFITVRSLALLVERRLEGGGRMP